MNKNQLMTGGNYVFAEPETIPCDCGSDEATWRGDRYGLRMYLCPDCASHYPELLAAESWGREDYHCQAEESFPCMD